MLDRLYLPILALAAAAAVALAMVWPQGFGDRSPDPFGSVPLQRTPAMQAGLVGERLTLRQIFCSGIVFMAPCEIVLLFVYSASFF